MQDVETLIAAAYAAFNQRNIDAALTLMTPGVTWPKASEGGSAVGKDEIRAYWERQWGEFDPHVVPLQMTPDPGGRMRVRVHQVVKDLAGNVLSDSEVLHLFSIRDGLISAMDLGDEGNPSTGGTSAFVHR